VWIWPLSGWSHRFYSVSRTVGQNPRFPIFRRIAAKFCTHGCLMTLNATDSGSAKRVGLRPKIPELVNLCAISMKLDIQGFSGRLNTMVALVFGYRQNLKSTRVDLRPKDLKLVNLNRFRLKLIYRVFGHAEHYGCIGFWPSAKL